MLIHKTKYAHMHIDDLISLAQHEQAELPEIAQELLFRLEDIRKQLPAAYVNETSREFLDRQLILA